MIVGELTLIGEIFSFFLLEKFCKETVGENTN